MEFGQAAWLTREGQEVLRPFHVRGSELYSDMTQRRPESALRESALRGASLPSNPDHSSDLAKRNQQIMETLRSRNPLLGQPTRPNTAQVSSPPHVYSRKSVHACPVQFCDAHSLTSNMNISVTGVHQRVNTGRIQAENEDSRR